MRQAPEDVASATWIEKFSAQDNSVDLKPVRHGAERNCGRFTGDYSYRCDIEGMHTIFDNHGIAYAVAHRRLDNQAVVYTVHAGDHLELVARAVLDVARGLIPDVLVWPGWHRRGLAAALCQLIEWEHGQAQGQSGVGSVAGRAFWESRAIDLSA